MSMAIMVMATVKNISKHFFRISALLGFVLLTPLVVLAGEWTFDPRLELTETYTSNVNLSNNKQQSSLVSQFIIGVDGEFISNKVFLSFAGTETLAAYSHDSELNDDYQTAHFIAALSIWDKGPQLVASSTTSNISQNYSDNSLADLVSGDTVQQQTHNAGIQYNNQTSNHSIKSSLVYNIIQAEDNIGERQGYTAIIDAKNGNNARTIFWQIDGQFTYLENNDLYGENYSIEAKLGAITPFKINPFIRLYNEEIKGSITGINTNTVPSLGPGVRWLVAKHIFVDLSYNYVDDNTNKSDNYVSTSVNWQPSQRTSLLAEYNQRFFGDSYNLDFTHRTKRLENSILYEETIEAFDRNTYLETELGSFWCPVPETNTGPTSITIEDCFLTEVPDDNYQPVTLFSLTPIQNNEYTLNKRLEWKSALRLARTELVFRVSNRERQALNSLIIDNYIDLNFNITRQLSAKGDLSLKATYKENTFDKHNQAGLAQKDIYKLVSATYNRKLAGSLAAFITLRYLDRESSRQDRTYQEVRASINITKDF